MLLLQGLLSAVKCKKWTWKFISPVLILAPRLYWHSFPWLELLYLRRLAPSVLHVLTCCRPICLMSSDLSGAFIKSYFSKYATNMLAAFPSPLQQKFVFRQQQSCPVYILESSSMAGTKSLLSSDEFGNIRRDLVKKGLINYTRYLEFILKWLKSPEKYFNMSNNFWSNG